MKYIWLSIWMVPTCWTSLCVWAQYQLQVCISPTCIRLGYVSHQPKYCIRQQAPVQCMYLTKQNTAPSTTHRWYVSHKHYQPHPQRLSHPARTSTIREVCLEQVCSDGVRRRKMCCQDIAYLCIRIPLLQHVDARIIIIFRIREGWRYQIRWIFGKIPNRLRSPSPHFRKIILQLFRKTSEKKLYKGPKQAI